VLLAACLVSAVALAANDKVTATFQELQLSGVSGEAVLNPNPPGGTIIHGQLRGLQPSTLYVSRVYTTDQACGVGTPSEEIVSFESNPAGIANFNRKVNMEIVDIRSISVELVSDGSLQACASVTP
jgi:hypothetical protein